MGLSQPGVGGVELACQSLDVRLQLGDFGLARIELGLQPRGRATCITDLSCERVALGLCFRQCGLQGSEVLCRFLLRGGEQIDLILQILH